MQIAFWAATDDGLTRDHNEDNFLVDKKLNLFIVADGMGGHAAGEVASSVAVREVRRVIAEGRQVVEDYAKTESAAGRKAVLALIDNAIRTACGRIYEIAQASAEKRGMGTTTSLMLVAGRRGFIGHVGDSRIYMVRTRQVHQLTEDHSLVNELIRRGRLKPGDVFDSPYKNAVTRAVGVYETVEVDTIDFDVLPGDDFLLCSDGLSCYIDDDLTCQMLSAREVKTIPGMLVEHANRCGGKDNITAVVVRLLPDDDGVEVAAFEQADEDRRRIAVLRGVPLYKFLGHNELVRLMNVSESVQFAAGQTIFEEGTRGDSMHVLLEGKVRLTRGSARLAELGPGSQFGEMALVDSSPRSATASAVGRARTIVVRRDAIFDTLQRDPILAAKLLWSMIQLLDGRLRTTHREMTLARETIEAMGRAGDGDLVAEVPPLDPALTSVASMPVGETDELVPSFVLTDETSGETDPMLRVDLRDDDAPLTSAPEDTEPVERKVASRVETSETAPDLDGRPTLVDSMPASFDGEEAERQRRDKSLPALNPPKDGRARTTLELERRTAGLPPRKRTDRKKD